jgi:hypothetical protein
MGKHWISLKDLRIIKKRKNSFKRISLKDIKQKSNSYYKPLIN